MSFLAPLYALGALAVALPILFHLIQRRPRGQQSFSSLMFLAPSVPRITRRSRLSDWLLLLLRAAALLLLAAAFARPFLRSLQQLTVTGSERHVAILLDRSASMRRQTVWDDAQTQLQEVLANLGPRDHVALFSFDDRFQEVVGFDAGHSDSSANIQAIRDQLPQLRPGWGSTDLGRALVDVVDRLRAATFNRTAAEQTIVLISDVQQGSRLESLQVSNWPPDVRLDVRQVRAAEGNATLQLLPFDESDDPSQLRVRVTNDEQSTTDTLQLIWASDEGNTDSTPLKSLQVPPGRSRVVSVERRAGESRLKLLGDAHPFDNIAYLAKVQPVEKRVLFFGDQRDAKDRQFFFLKRAELGSAEFSVRVEAGSGIDAPAALDPLETPLLVLAQPTPVAWTDVLRAFVQQGGRILVVMDPTEYSAGQPEADTTSLAALLELQTLQADVVQAENYAMLSQVDFQNSLFLPFADAKFNDFTKIRIWSYHRLIADHEQPWSVLARFDDDSVALAERAVGAGRIWILTTGWSPESSQLALSTKFVPLLVSMLGSAVESQPQQRHLTVGQAIDLTRRAAFAQAVTPQGSTFDLSIGQREFSNTDAIGIYRFIGQPTPWEVAVNLDPAEARTVPMDLAELERRGVLMGAYESAENRDRRERQMRDVELESQQKLWRWLVVAALSVLAIETYVAGRSSHHFLSAEPGEG